MSRKANAGAQAAIARDTANLASAVKQVDLLKAEIVQANAALARAQNSAVSCTGMPSVITMHSGICASIASITASLVPDAGTKTTDTSAPVAAMVSATWSRGQRRPPAPLMTVLRHVSVAAQRAHLKLFVLVWHGLARETPRTPAERADFAVFAAATVKALPNVRHVVVGNEPNLDTFWKPQFGATGLDLAASGYEDLLARSYDAIKAVDHDVLVIGGSLSPRGADRPHGSRPTHSPTSFIRDLGAAYRASARTKPLMDAFALHPYMEASRFPPTTRHPKNTSITIADYPKLVALLSEAFKGTDQRGATLPIYYTEFGVQTRVPLRKLSAYDDSGSPGRSDSVTFARQADYYRSALELAYCQPTVRGLFLFHTFDEADLAGWQSGLYFADGTPKPSLPVFKRTVADLRNGRFPTCSR